MLKTITRDLGVLVTRLGLDTKSSTNTQRRQPLTAARLVEQRPLGFCAVSWNDFIHFTAMLTYSVGENVAHVNEECANRTRFLKETLI